MTRMGLKWRQLVVLDSAPLFFLSTCRLPFTDASTYASLRKCRVHVYAHITTPVKRDAALVDRPLRFFYDNALPRYISSGLSAIGIC